MEVAHIHIVQLILFAWPCLLHEFKQRMRRSGVFSSLGTLTHSKSRNMKAVATKSRTNDLTGELAFQIKVPSALRPCGGQEMYVFS